MGVEYGSATQPPGLVAAPSLSRRLVGPMSSAKTNAPERDLAEAGRQAARRLFREGRKATAIEDPLSPAFASAAMAELERLMAEELPGLARDIIEGAGIGAHDLNVRPEQGIVEVIQNADDVAASRVLVAVRRHGRSTRLHVVHDGSPVFLPDVVGMTYAFFSTKREDATSKGKFGIGLKTLTQIATRMEVHCAPYHFAVVDQRLTQVPPSPAIAHVYEPDAGQTMLVLDLRSDYDAAALAGWARSWDASSMLFLDSVRNVRVRDSAAVVVDHELVVDCDDIIVPLGTARATPIARRRLRDPASQRSWTRYLVERDVPAKYRKSRAHKATGATTPLGIAVCEDSAEQGRIFAGLPLDMPCRLPFALHGQFDPDTSRTRLKRTHWNHWVIGQLAHLTSEVTLARFTADPATGWGMTPLANELAGGDDWAIDEFNSLIKRVQTSVERHVALGKPSVALRDLVYEAPGLRELLDEQLQQRLCPGRHPVELEWRDRHERWREVLDDLGLGVCLELKDIISALGDDDMHVDPEWIVGLTATCIEANLGVPLSRTKSVLLADGSRMAPATVAREGVALVTTDDHRTLASRLGLTREIHPALLADSPAARTALAFAEEYAGLSARPDSLTALTALSDRDGGGPLTLDDIDLLALRQALQEADDEQRREMGPRIGRNILVRGTQRTKGARKSSEIQVSPGSAYLPSSIEGQTDGFARAAQQTPGLRWIHTHYDALLKSPQGRRPDALGARALFVLLGAETAPRLRAAATNDSLRDDVARRLAPPLPAVQEIEVAGRPITHLKDDFDSPDLDAVIADIRRDRLPRRRARARALFLTLNRSWARLYEEHQTALGVERDYVFRPRGPVVATWLASAASQAWMTNERRKAMAPYELAVRTPAYVAAIGADPSDFAYGLDAEDASLPVVRALLFKHQPPASQLVDTLVALRDAEIRGDDIDPQRVRRCYAVLASHCPRDGDARHKTDDRRKIDDLTLAELRARFQRRAGKPGLIRTQSGWRSPTEVYDGRAIFGRWRDAVPHGADELWEALGVRNPDVTECIDVLGEIAQAAYDPRDRSTLIDVYRQVADLLAESHGRPPTRIRSLPLWTGSRWDSGPRIHAVTNPALEEPLGERITVWRAPCSLRGLEPLLKRRGVVVLPERSFQAEAITDTALRNGATHQPRFTQALRELRSILAERDDQHYHALTATSWDDVLTLRVAITSRLRVEIPVPGRDPVSVRTRAHVDPTELLAAFSDVDAIGRDDEGGWAISTLFDGGDRDKVAWAWAAAWQRSATTGVRDHIQLSEDETAEDPLDAMQRGAVAKLAKRRLAKRQGSVSQPSAGANDGPARIPTPPRPVARRHLKRFDTVAITSVELVNVDAREGQPTTRRRRGLRVTLPSPPTVPSFDRGDGAGVRAYDDNQRQDLGYRVLAAVLKEIDDRDLSDYQAVRGIGADALDQLKRAVEMKAYSREMPTTVSLSANEADKAAEQRSDYLLAVVSGLEEGFETRVRLFADPLRTLDWVEGQDIELGGIHNKRGLDLVVSDTLPIYTQVAEP
jgi:hypothetical protein